MSMTCGLSGGVIVPLNYPSAKHAPQSFSPIYHGSMMNNKALKGSSWIRNLCLRWGSSGSTFVLIWLASRVLLVLAGAQRAS